MPASPRRGRTCSPRGAWVLSMTDCVVLEDSATGIAAARAAHAGAVIGVGDSARGRGCDAVIADLAAARWTDAGLETARTIEHGSA